MKFSEGNDQPKIFLWRTEYKARETPKILLLDAYKKRQSRATIKEMHNITAELIIRDNLRITSVCNNLFT